MVGDGVDGVGRNVKFFDVSVYHSSKERVTAQLQTGEHAAGQLCCVEVLISPQAVGMFNPVVNLFTDPLLLPWGIWPTVQQTESSQAFFRNVGFGHQSPPDLFCHQIAEFKLFSHDMT